MTNRKFHRKEAHISTFDPANYLDSKEAMAAYLQTALEENDPDFLMAALNDVIRAQGIAEVAGKAGLGRESLYKTLKPGAEPRLGTVLRLLGALDLRLSIAAPQGGAQTKTIRHRKDIIRPVSCNKETGTTARRHHQDDTGEKARHDAHRQERKTRQPDLRLSPAQSKKMPSGSTPDGILTSPPAAVPEPSSHHFFSVVRPCSASAFNQPKPAEVAPAGLYSQPIQPW
ncbi:addiction module antidote protein [Herbaspirillum huttiense]|uniref:addiction module antidote protein n=1 Tax=Herbaspirillum huttiense TaxID=863372 RepID=UPI0039AECA60